MRAIQHAAETFCEGRRIQTLRAFRRTQGRPEGRCLSIFQNWKSQNVQNGSSESAASVTDGHQIGRKMRPNPVQIRGKNVKNREKIVDSLNNSKSFIRYKLTQRIQMRRIPELTFKIDRALEKGLAVLKLLDKLRDQKKN